jgi:hypothetical protein
MTWIRREHCHFTPEADLMLPEEGQSQTIRYFSREGDLPLTLGQA